MAAASHPEDTVGRDERTLDLGALVTAKVLALSDTHAHLDPRVLAAVAGADLVVHAGDVGGAAVLRDLAERAPRVVAVRGNNDVPAKWPPSERALLATLPRVARVALPGGWLVVEHGHEAGAAKGRHARLRARYPDARAVLVGHSHRLLLDDEERPWVLNPGAAGRERTYGGPSFAVLLCTRRGWRAELQRLSPAPRGKKR